MDLIRTARLDLHLLTVEDLLNLDADPASKKVWDRKPFKNSNRVLIDDESPLLRRIAQVKVEPAVNKWLVRVAVLREINEVVGSSSFHLPPDEIGMIEIGLGVHQDFRRKGIAKELLSGMWGWVIQQPGVNILRYTADAKNIASIRLIECFGFAHIGQQLDEEDGPEEIYEMSVQDFRMRNLL